MKTGKSVENVATEGRCNMIYIPAIYFELLTIEVIKISTSIFQSLSTAIRQVKLCLC